MALFKFNGSDKVMIHSVLENGINEGFIRMIRESPDFTPWHNQLYLNYSSQVNGYADMLVFHKSGNPFMALPLHRIGYKTFSTGYSGIIFSKEIGNNFKWVISILIDFFKSNSDLNFKIIQSFQSSGGMDIYRQTALAFEINKYLTPEIGWYTRIIDLKKNNLDSNVFDIQSRLYDSKLRSQLKKISTLYKIEHLIVQNEQEVVENWKSIYNLYRSSRVNTGMKPRSIDDLIEESLVYIKSGGQEVYVFAVYDLKIVSLVQIKISGCTALYNMSFTDNNIKLNPNALCLHHGIVVASNLHCAMFEIGRINYKHSDVKEIAIDGYKSQFASLVSPLICLDVNKFNFIQKVIRKIV